MIAQGRQINHTRVGMLGLTFKEDVPDLRNTRVVDIIAELEDYGIEVIVHDPMADPSEAKAYYGIDLKSLDAFDGVDALVMAVSHAVYCEMGLTGLAALCKKDQPPVVVDVKSVFDPKTADDAGIVYWRL